MAVPYRGWPPFPPPCSLRPRGEIDGSSSRRCYFTGPNTKNSQDPGVLKSELGVLGCFNITKTGYQSHTVWQLGNLKSLALRQFLRVRRRARHHGTGRYSRSRSKVTVTVTTLGDFVCSSFKFIFLFCLVIALVFVC